MAYSNLYNASELGEITIDGIASVGAIVVGFATLIGLALLYGWAKKNLR